MPWIKAVDLKPSENERILIYDNSSNRMEHGRYVDGRWYLEGMPDGQLIEITGVTHWAPILDSEVYDSSDD